MSSQTSIMAASFRLQEWAAQIRECQSRPAGMSVASWCAANGITKANYYYRLRRVRKACLEHIQKEIPAQQIVPVEPGLLQREHKDGTPYALTLFCFHKYSFLCYNQHEVIFDEN